MPDVIPRFLLEAIYSRAAHEYQRKLKPEKHLMEAWAQARQREITVESFALIHAHRPDIQYFNELLLQYPIAGRRKPGGVLPDNMVVVHDQPLQVVGSYALPLQPVGPILVLEYVSSHNERKDYVQNMDKYEKGAKVPYYLLFNPEAQELNLYHLAGGKYVTVLPNEQERYLIPELEIEVRILDGWVRYWFRGQLIPLPADLQNALGQAKQEAAKAREGEAKAQQDAAKARQEAEKARQEATAAIASQKAMEQELARLRALLDQKGQP